MAKRKSLARAGSATSTSTLSSICVAVSDSSAGASSPSPTPATSVSAGDTASVKQETTAPVEEEPQVLPAANASSRRSGRQRSSVDSYNLATMSDLQFGKQVARVKEARSFSGETLVNEAVPDAETPGNRRRRLEGEVDKALDMDWQVGRLEDVIPEAGTSGKSKRKSGASLLSKAADKISSALGKRFRGQTESSTPSTEDDDGDVPPSKRARLLETIAELSTSIHRTSSTKVSKKRWLDQGLYCGQAADSKGTLTESKQRSKTTPAAGADVSAPVMPYPLYSAGTREADFRLPYDVFAPLQRKEVPKDWKKLSKNLFTPSAKEVWRTKKLERSVCLCRPPIPGTGEEGCDENCLNRTMLYECDNNNCALTEDQCTNRAFADLNKRTKKGNPFDIGVEIIKTKECGHGLRANRPFAPGQIIIEYCGEVITQEESDRRMHQLYKEKEAYYLMEFDQGMIIDATKGNIARFVNHSCVPNCQMEKRIVRGEPKMALFAGVNGVMTGEELTYDYNFDNFSTLNVLDCRCGADLCRGKLERRDAKRDQTLAATLKRKLVEAAATPEPVAAPQPLKKRKTGRWSKGWAYVDPEMEAERLREDAIEKGKGIDSKALESLKKHAIETKQEEVVEGRGKRGASVKAKEKLMERANSVRNRISKKAKEEEKEGAIREKKEKRKSWLNRMNDALGNSPDQPAQLVESFGQREPDVEATQALLKQEEEEAGKASIDTKRSAKSMKQTTLNWTPVNNKPQPLPKPAPLDDGVDVLEMVLNIGGAARGGTLA